MAGRNSKLNPERQDRICNALREGNTRRVAAILGGIGESTFYDWLSWGDPEHENYSEKYAEFSEAVTRAEAEAEERMVLILFRDAALNEKDGYKAAVEWLKRRKPQDWSEKTRIDLTSGDEPINTIQMIEVRRDGEDS